MTPSKAKTELPLTATAVSVAVTHAATAANDDSIATSSNDLRNPLWIIAVGMGCFFGMTAAVMALT